MASDCRLLSYNYNKLRLCKSVSLDALDLVGVQQKQLKRGQSFEDSAREVFDLITVEDPVGAEESVSKHHFDT